MNAPLVPVAALVEPADPAARQTVLAARDVGFAHAGVGTIFEKVSLSIRRREIVALLGSSGCGKSTLLRVLAGLEAPATGDVRFLDQPQTRPHPRSALVFQQPSLLPWLNLAGNVGFGLDFAHQPASDQESRRQRVTAAIEAVGLKGREGAFPAQLSGGMAQRAALARALAREPELLFADEPFSALDAITRAEMQTLLVDLVHRWHTAALLVTHDIDEAILVAERIVLMGGRPGHLVQEWTVDIPHPREDFPSEVTALRLSILGALRHA